MLCLFVLLWGSILAPLELVVVQRVLPRVLSARRLSVRFLLRFGFLLLSSILKSCHIAFKFSILQLSARRVKWGVPAVLGCCNIRTCAYPYPRSVFGMRAESSSAMLGCCASEHHLPPLLGRFSAMESICILGCLYIRRYTYPPS